MEPNKKKINLDDAIRAMQSNEPSAEQSREATAKVLSSLNTELGRVIPDRLRTEADFGAMLKPYLRNELTEAQKMLVEDHLASNPAYRRQLEELKGNVRTMPQVSRQRSTTRTVLPWAIAAGLILTTGYFTMDSLDRLMAPSGARAEIANVSGDIYKVSAAGLVAVKLGTPLQEGEAVRTAKGSSAVVRLPDGSLIEMNERAELSISAAYSGSTIRLERGNILVQAAKQKKGSLKVATRESTVSVKGTIFSVAAGLRGTQVAVVEGHIVVDQGGKAEDLLPGQTTGSQAMLKRTNVEEQIAWSKDSAKYMAMISELSKISKQIEALPMPALRTQSRLLSRLPADTVVFAAIPNISGTVADATKIFEERMKQSPVLKEWWSSKEVGQVRELAERLRTVGNQLGEEIVIAASIGPNRSVGHPVLMAEVKGANARMALEPELKQFGSDHVLLTDAMLIVGERPAEQSGFENSQLASSVKKSYAKGAGWILAVDLAQILTGSVNNNMTGINQVRHLMVERRDIAGRANASASVGFSAARSGIASWLAAPAPMPSLDYISPDATFAMSAVTKDARSMAEEFFSMTGAQVAELEKQIGISVINDIAGPLGGEVTMAVDGALLPVPAYVFATEVYDAGRLTTTLRRVVEAFNTHSNGAHGTLSLTEQTANGQRFYQVKHSAMPVEIHFVYSGGYMVAAGNRDTIVKALQNRTTQLSLPLSQKFISLLPADAEVNASAILYANFGMALPELGSEPVLIVAYAGPDSIRVSSSSGFFGLGLDSLMSMGKGTPMMPQLLSSIMGNTGLRKKITKQ
ncbi:MAG: FecR domain-containing protein [Acidobacteria bacterium]|nr:FecR domain-containing protein [Acidobacteriota bacterium]